MSTAVAKSSSGAYLKVVQSNLGISGALLWVSNLGLNTGGKSLEEEQSLIRLSQGRDDEHSDQ